MFTLDSTIDSIQTTKKTIISNVFAKNEKIAEALNHFVDAQTEYTKNATRAGTALVENLYTETVRLSQEASKFDFTKAYETFAESFNSRPSKTK
jgi:hypothetical protein